MAFEPLLLLLMGLIWGGFLIVGGLLAGYRLAAYLERRGRLRR